MTQPHTRIQISVLCRIRTATLNPDPTDFFTPTSVVMSSNLVTPCYQRVLFVRPQVEREFNRIAPELSSLAVYGGTASGPQIGEMRRGVDIIVGTPGRIIDHIEQGNLNLVSWACSQGGGGWYNQRGWTGSILFPLGKASRVCFLCIFLLFFVLDEAQRHVSLSPFARGLL